jgi:hypothetical protein
MIANRLLTIATSCCAALTLILLGIAFTIPLRVLGPRPVEREVGVGHTESLSKAERGTGLSSAFPPESCSDLPWHIADIDRYYCDDFKTDAVQVDLHVLDDPPYPPNCFVVPIQGTCNGRLFYLGIDTNLDYGQRKGGKRSALGGHGIVFSRWGDMDPDATEPSPDGFFLASDHEGQLVSVRIRYPWGKGRYSLRLEKLQQRESQNDNVWVGAYIYSHQSKEMAFVGALRFPGTEIKFSYRTSIFVELCGDAKARPKVPFPGIRVAIGDIYTRAGQLRAGRITADHHAWIPQYGKVWTGTNKSAYADEITRLFPNDKTALLIVVSHENAVIQSWEETQTLYPINDESK